MDSVDRCLPCRFASVAAGQATQLVGLVMSHVGHYAGSCGVVSVSVVTHSGSDRPCLNFFVGFDLVVACSSSVLSENSMLC